MTKKIIKSVAIIKKSAAISLKEYAPVFLGIKNMVRESQIEAATKVNQELINLYWSLGKIIHEQQELSGWGSKFIEKLPLDLSNEFQGVGGFSRANLFRMKAFYLEYQNSLPPVRQFTDMPNVSIFSRIPWGHNVLLIEKIKLVEERLWYAHKAIENGWSRNVLAMQIDSKLYKRQGKAITNFSRTLATPQSDLAVQILKDPYVVDFITLRDNYVERDVEQGLIDHIQSFLLELGRGFAFVGRQVHLQVDEQDYYIDLLFYHIELNCYVVIELKTGTFNPRDTGQIGFYLAAVDAQLKRAGSNPTIGLILCQNKSKLTVEYALSASKGPIAVSSYTVGLVESLPKNLKGKLPTVAEIEQELEKRELFSQERAKKKEVRRKSKPVMNKK